MRAAWWKNALVYQIYPLSFCDDNGDGIGDLSGIITKLGYLKDLGVDVIWLSPIYQSPMDDNGYDISDYYAIDPVFGTMEDFRRLLASAHSLGMRLIMDLVVNHTSDQHSWFQEARKSKDNPFRDYYVWRKMPTEIQSVFSGPAWEYDPLTEQYYFHLFSKKQPDLNWDNPVMRQEIYKMINYWLDFGIDGFRLDVIDLIGKDIDNFRLCDGPYLDERLLELKSNCFVGRDVMTVGETPCLSIERVRDVTRGETPLLDMVFQFGHLALDEIPSQGKWALKKLDLIELKRHFKSIQNGLENVGWNSLFWTNHDQPRAVSRYGDEAKRYECATMLATSLYSMQGTPYVYQGEELGMTGIRFSKLSDYRDIETKNMVLEKSSQSWSIDKIMESIYAKGRDNSRTPMQWDDTIYAGFSLNKPWIDVNPNHMEINAKKELADKNSVFSYFRNYFKLRKTNPLFMTGHFQLIFEDHPSLFCYLREGKEKTLLVICSFSNNWNSADFQDIPKGKWLITNISEIDLGAETTFPPYFAGIYEYDTVKGTN